MSDSPYPSKSVSGSAFRHIPFVNTLGIVVRPEPLCTFAERAHLALVPQPAALREIPCPCGACEERREAARIAGRFLMEGRARSARESINAAEIEQKAQDDKWAFVIYVASIFAILAIVLFMVSRAFVPSICRLIERWF